MAGRPSSAPALLNTRRAELARVLLYTGHKQHSNAHVDQNAVPYFGLPWRAGKRQHKSQSCFCALHTLCLRVLHAKARRRWVGVIGVGFGCRLKGNTGRHTTRYAVESPDVGPFCGNRFNDTKQGLGNKFRAFNVLGRPNRKARVCLCVVSVFPVPTGSVIGPTVEDISEAFVTVSARMFCSSGVIVATSL